MRGLRRFVFNCLYGTVQSRYKPFSHLLEPAVGVDYSNEVPFELLLGGALLVLSQVLLEAVSVGGKRLQYERGPVCLGEEFFLKPLYLINTGSQMRCQPALEIFFHRRGR